jgi:hypothetical protein
LPACMTAVPDSSRAGGRLAKPALRVGRAILDCCSGLAADCGVPVGVCTAWRLCQHSLGAFYMAKSPLRGLHGEIARRSCPHSAAASGRMWRRPAHKGLTPGCRGQVRGQRGPAMDSAGRMLVHQRVHRDAHLHHLLHRERLRQGDWLGDSCELFSSSGPPSESSAPGAAHPPHPLLVSSF